MQDVRFTILLAINKKEGTGGILAFGGSSELTGDIRATVTQ
jgi:hypothetical protein